MNNGIVSVFFTYEIHINIQVKTITIESQNQYFVKNTTSIILTDYNFEKNIALAIYRGNNVI